MKPTTPKVITSQVSSFLKSISPAPASYLPYVGLGKMEFGRCHLNVRSYVENQGGNAVYGWLIWESSIHLEAEFHCVWEDHHGDLWDITPRVDAEPLVLFLPDPRRFFDWKRNISWANRYLVKGSQQIIYTVGGNPSPSERYRVVF
jgi:hypothetical protein